MQQAKQTLTREVPSKYGDEASGRYNLLQPGAKKRKYGREFSGGYFQRFCEASLKARNANPPLFIPNLTEMRQRCLEHLGSELRILERKMQDKGTQEPKDVAKAIELMRDMGTWPLFPGKSSIRANTEIAKDMLIKSEARRFKFEDPEYSGSRGLNVAHLEMEHQSGMDWKKTGTWLMLSKDFEQSGRDVIEPCKTLSEYQFIKKTK
ncbi:hypothetical protein IWX50DRAFT_612376 [Phyllosticta citricarpa]